MTSEDDPHRLWCVCRKPHNNRYYSSVIIFRFIKNKLINYYFRFMICCDTCENWFHGKCVGITKALGEQMEARGVEWNCPQCKKKISEDARKKIEENKIMKKVEEEKKDKSSPKSPTKKSDSRTSKIQSQSQLNCCQCQKTIESTAVSLFCDEKCLDKHIEDSIIAIKACCTSESPDIILFDKKNSRLITGK